MNTSDLFKLSITYEVDFELPRFETVRFGRNSIKYIGLLLVEVAKTDLRMIETLNSEH